MWSDFHETWWVDEAWAMDESDTFWVGSGPGSILILPQWVHSQMFQFFQDEVFIFWLYRNICSDEYPSSKILQICYGYKFSAS